MTVAAGGNLTIGSTDAKYAGVFTFRVLTYGTAGGGALPGNEDEDTSVGGINSLLEETDIDVPTGTWGFVNFGVYSDLRLGEWHRFLIADLTGVTAAAGGTAVSSSNSLVFLADEETYFYLGMTTGGKITAAASSTTSPGTVRVRSN